VTAQIHFALGREPAQVVAARAGLHEKSGLRDIVLGGDALHQSRVQPAVQRHDGGGISFQRLAGESIDLPEFEFHDVPL